MDLTLAQNVGVDISKDFLDVAFYPASQTQRFANDAKGLRALVKYLKPLQVKRVVFEATGAYHRLFERTLAQAGLPMVKVNPRQARSFREALGKLAKTDRCDAAMLAHMGASLALEPRPVVSKTLDEMKELLKARDALIKDRVAALNREKTALSALVKTQNVARLRQIASQIKAIDQRQKELRRTDPDLSEPFDILKSIPSFGDVTANALLIEMSELGSLNEEQASSLSGLAPVANDSGKSSGRRSIRGGRARVRSALYMAALSAIRFHPEYSVKYKAMIKAGKPAKVALVAIMRKLLILANALLRDRRKWTRSAPKA
ncbi:MAG TPA: IS110 family transposase [Rhizomicrobium sp.]|jgi:transposase|nr:IS110 family transposase [Rhizomicrobium sp.]